MHQGALLQAKYGVDLIPDINLETVELERALSPSTPRTAANRQTHLTSNFQANSYAACSTCSACLSDYASVSNHSADLRLKLLKLETLGLVKRFLTHGFT